MDLPRKYVGGSLSRRGTHGFRYWRTREKFDGERISFFDQTKSSISSFGPERKKEQGEHIHISSSAAVARASLALLSFFLHHN